MTKQYVCRHCYKPVMNSHFCEKTGESYTIDETDDLENFLVSFAVSALTDNAFFGTIIGGDVVGGILGDLFMDGELL